MTQENNESEDAEPLRPHRPEPSPSYTHKTSAFRRIGKKWGVYKEVGVAKAPPCPHCGAPYTESVKIYVDRLIAFGGATGGFLLTANDVQPPQLKREYAGQPEFNEKDILPES